MGVFSKHNRFREAGEDTNIYNEAEFGEPHHSLFTASKVFSLHHRIEITDKDENTVYRAETKFPSLHDRTDITNASGRHVAHIDRKFFSIHQRHFVTMADGTSFEMSNELLHIIRHITNIEGLGWQLQGNILGLNFRLLDADGSIIALVSQKMISLHDKYCVDIYQPELEPMVVAVLITLQHMIRDQEAAASSGASGSSGSSG